MILRQPFLKYSFNMGRYKDNVHCLLNHNREKKSIAFGQEYTCCRDLLIRDSLTENEGFENRKYQNINKRKEAAENTLPPVLLY